MYESPVLREAMRTLYMTQPWANVMSLSIYKDPWWGLLTPYDGYIVRPPIQFVTFVATTVSSIPPAASLC